MKWNKRIFYGNNAIKKIYHFFFFLVFVLLAIRPLPSIAAYTCAIEYTSCNAGYYLKEGYWGSDNSYDTCVACSTVSFNDTDVINVSNGSRSRTCYRSTSPAGATSASQCTGSTNCGAWTYTCNSGYYLSGTSCLCLKSCNSLYNTSGTASCIPTNTVANAATTSCPTGTKQCTGLYTNGACYTAGGTCSGCSQYGACSTSCVATSCNEHYYLSDGQCLHESNLGSGYYCPAGNTGSGACYKTCTVTCSGNNTSACPEHATCTYNTAHTSSGTQYYGGTCSANASLCPLSSFSCSEGYSKNSAGTGCVANTITINYDENGGSSVSNGTCTYGGNFTLPSGPTKSGSVFSGWKLANGSIYSAGDTVSCTKTYVGVASGTSTAIVAQYGTAQTFNITYSANGGSGSAPTSPTTCQYGTLCVAPEFTYTRAYCEPQFWSCTNCLSSEEVNGVTVWSTPDPGEYFSPDGAGDITLKPYWSCQEFTITLDDNGGSGGSGSIRERYDGYFKYSNGNLMYSSSRVNLPTKSNGIFKGYYTAASGGTQIIDTTGKILVSNTYFTSDTTLYAQWDEGYTVTFDANWPRNYAVSTSGTTASKTCTYNTSCALTSNGYKINNGYTFNGWNTRPDGSGTAYSDGASVTDLGDTTLYAQWTPWTYTLRFQLNVLSSFYPVTGNPTVNGEAISLPYQMTCTVGEPCVLPDADAMKIEQSPMWGWSTYRQNGLTSPTKDAIIFTPGENIPLLHETTFYLTNGKATTLYTLWRNTLMSDITCPMCDPGVGATCVIMNRSNFCAYETMCKIGYDDIEGDGEYNPSCTPITYTVRFNANDGSGAKSTQSFTYDESQTLNTDLFTRSGYTLAGWATSADADYIAYDDGESVVNLSDVDGTIIDLYAVWTPNCNKITIDPFCGANPVTQYVYKLTNSSGWFSDSECTVPTDSITPTSCPGWEGWGVSATRADTRGDNDGSGLYFTKDGKTTTLGYDWIVTAPATLYQVRAAPCATSTGCSCSLSVSDTGVVDYTTGASTGYTLSSGANTYAPSCTPNTYRVTLDKQNGTGGTSEYYYQYNTWNTCCYYTTNALSACVDGNGGEVITIPTRTGYTFGGYYTGLDGTGTQYVNADGLTVNRLYTKVASNTTLYAKWTPCTYTIKFDANGGTGTMGNQSFTYGESQTLNINTFTRSGYTFKGWSRWASETTASYTDGQSVTNFTTECGATVTLYAVWSVNTYKCDAGKYLPAGGTSCASCPSGSYCPGGSFTYNATTDQGKNTCVAGSYSTGASDTCTACPAGTTSSAGATGASSCTACSNATNVSSWATSSWNSDNTMTNLCKATGCKSGAYYSASNNGSCTLCSTANNTSTKEVAISGGVQQWRCTGKYTYGAGGANGVSACLGCSNWSLTSVTCDTSRGCEESADGKSCECSGMCVVERTYSTCDPDYYMTYNGEYDGTPKAGNACTSCPDGYVCSGGQARPFKTLTFNLNGGTGTTPGNKKCNYGESCTLDGGTGTTWYRAGYKFVGWSTNKNATSGSTNGSNFRNGNLLYAIWSACASGTYKAAGVAAKNACSACPAGYANSNLASTEINSCYVVTDAGKYVATAGAGQTACISPYYCPGGSTIYYNQTGGKKNCDGSSGSREPGAPEGGNIYQASDPGASSYGQCYAVTTPGYYLATEFEIALYSCQSGDWCPGGIKVYAGSTGGNNPCPVSPDASRPATSADGSTAQSDCYVDCFYKDIENGSALPVNGQEHYNGTAYPACTYIADCNPKFGAVGNRTENPTCESCATGYYGPGADSACIECSNKPTNSSYTGNAASNACPWKCDDGYNQTYNKQCAQLCPVGVQYIRTNSGLSIPLYTSAQTVPSIHVQYQNNICHASLIAGQSSDAININYNDQIYHTTY